MNPRTGVRDYRPLIAVSAPIAGIQLAQVALTTTDLTMMGLMSVEAIAAGGLAIPLYNQLRTLCVGMVTAVGNLVASSAARGEDDRKAAGERLGGKAEEEVRQVVRSAFLVDERGRLEQAWPKVSPKDTPTKLLDALAGA